MARSPHEEHADRERINRELDELEARQAAKYGMPYEKLPEVLRYPPPEHPRRHVSRREDNKTTVTWRSYVYGRGESILGWKTLRKQYLDRLERIRHAEIDMRKLRTKHTGRGKPLDRKAHVHARERIEAREWRDEL